MAFNMVISSTNKLLLTHMPCHPIRTGIQTGQKIWLS